MKIFSWNVNGLRSVLSKGFEEFLEGAGADAVCLQETKAFPEQVTRDFTGWKVYWNPAKRPGYSGTVTFCRVEPLQFFRGIGHPACDAEGRVLTLEFADFYLVNVYAPNAGPELARLDFKIREWSPSFAAFLSRLEEQKPVVFCGDMNVAVEEVDLARPKENEGKAGFTEEERNEFRRLLGAGYVDTFRLFEKGGGHYTWWSYRAGARQRNVGWRIDYCCASARLLPRLEGARIHAGVLGSDHCPVELRIRPELAKNPAKPPASPKTKKLSNSRRAEARESQ